MKKLFHVFLIVAALGISACGGDDEKNNPPPANPKPIQTTGGYGDGEDGGGCYEYDTECSGDYCDSGWVDVGSSSCGW